MPTIHPSFTQVVYVVKSLEEEPRKTSNVVKGVSWFQIEISFYVICYSLSIFSIIPQFFDVNRVKLERYTISLLTHLLWNFLAIYIFSWLNIISSDIPVNYMKIVEKYHLLMRWTAALNRVDQISDVFCTSSVLKNRNVTSFHTNLFSTHYVQFS